MISETLRPVAEYFDREGISFEPGSDGRDLRSAFRGTHGVHRLRVVDSDSVLLFQVPELLYAGPEHRGAVCARLAELNYRLLLTRFGCDPTDGEVTVEYVIPPQPHPATEEQISMAVSILLQAADESLRELSLLNLLGKVPVGAGGGRAPDSLADGDAAGTHDLLEALGYEPPGTDERREP